MLNFSNASTRPARQTTRCSFTSSSPPRPSRISYFTDAEPDARKSGEDVETVYLRVRAGFPPIGNAAAARHLPFRKGEEKTCRVKRYHRCLFVLIHSRPPPILLPPPPPPHPSPSTITFRVSYLARDTHPGWLVRLLPSAAERKGKWRRWRGLEA